MTAATHSPVTTTVSGAAASEFDEASAAEHPLTEPVFDCLRQIIDPCSSATATPMNLVEMGLIDKVVFSDGDSRVDVHLRLTSPQCLMVAYMTKAARELIGELDGVEHVDVHADHGLDWVPEMISEGAQHRRRLSLEVRSAGMASSGCASHKSADSGHANSIDRAVSA